jgi:prophage tail gpP-like protein
MVGRPQEIAKLLINGKEYIDWTSVMVTVRFMDYFPQFSFECTEFSPVPSERGQLQIVPGDVVEVYLAGYLVVTGFVVERHAGYDASNHGIQINGVGMSYNLTISSVWTQSGEFDKMSIEQFTRAMLAPTGVGLKTRGDIDNTPFEQIHVQPGEIIAAAIERYARMRKTIVGSTEFGDLALVGDHRAELSDYLIEGGNILSANCALRDDNVYEQYIALGQQYGSDDLWGDQVSKQAAKVAGSSKQPKVHVDMADVADSLHGLQKRAEFAKQMLENLRIEAHITVQGWLRDNGELWRAGAYYWVQSPSLVLNQLLGCKQITYEQDSARGTITTLHLVDPTHMSGQYDIGNQPALK